MGQKINPTGFRLPVTRNWTSRWYANGRDYPNTLQEDLKVRSFLLKKLRNASVARGITQQLEKRVMFRRAMKRAMQNAMRLGALGIKVQSSGRLNGADIARDEWYREGRVPLQTLRANIDYATSEAHTTYGVVGVKVWVYKGDNFGAEEPVEAPREDRRGRRGDRPGKPGARRPNGGRRNDMKQDRAPRKPAAKDGE